MSLPIDENQQYLHLGVFSLRGGRLHDFANADKTGTLTSKMTNGAGSYWPGELITNAARDVDATETQHFLDLIDAMEFWRMPTKDESSGMDGSEWILEGYSQGIYQVIARWSPREGTLRELGLYPVFRLGRFDARAGKIY